MKKILYGLLKIDGNFGYISIETEIVADWFQEYFQVGDKLSVRYYISSEPINSEEEATEALLNKMFSGIIEELYYVLDAYSEVTILEFREDCIIGGHNIIEELSSYDNKYCFLIVEKIEG